LTVATLVDLICVDVEATLRQDVTEPEIVASHCRVTAPVECRDVRIAKPISYEPLGFVVIEQDPLETLFREWLPALKTLPNIYGYSTRIVPELYDDLGYVGRVRECVNRSSFLDELPDVLGAETVVFRTVDWTI
jgi:hypothetical protein